MNWGTIPGVCAAAAAVLFTLQAEAPAHAQQVRITGLADANFGTLNSPTDYSISDNVCAYSRQGFTAVDYGVLATGSGSGGAFLLSSGANTLAYEVFWTDAPNQTSGTQLTAGVLSPGYGNASLFQTCAFQPQGTATLTVTIRATAITAATAGNYSGVLTITIIPE